MRGGLVGGDDDRRGLFSTSRYVLLLIKRGIRIWGL